jgi:hypothetical protein
MMYVKWIGIQVFYWAYVLIAVFVYPFIYPFQKYIPSWFKPLWWMLHNEPYGHPWYWTKFGIPLAKEGEIQIEPKGLKKFWISYNWSVFRNGCWHLFNEILKQKQGEVTELKEIKPTLSFDGKIYSPFTVFRLKFKTNGIPTDNVGTEIDLDLTYQGRTYITYKQGGVKYWLYSYCKVDKVAREFTIGWNGSRPLIRNKRKTYGHF